jgi:isoquinoline 1-oxidoreductase alpha subunit
VRCAAACTARAQAIPAQVRQKAIRRSISVLRRKRLAGVVRGSKNHPIATFSEPAMATMPLVVNGVRRTHAGDAEQPLLWVLRDELGLTGTKYGCGVGQCGACTVHVDGEAAKACLLPVGSLAGKAIVTIEGLARSQRVHAVQQAWIEGNVPQCGYCQSGQMMAAAALLARHARPTDEEIDAAMRGNLCRCGTYERIRKAVHRAAELVA